MSHSPSYNVSITFYKKMTKTAKTKHPDYHRYLSMVQRCYDSKHGTYVAYGKLGILVCEEWHPDNKEGFNNFANWFSTQLINLSISDKSKIRVSRKDKKSNYGPLNCILITCCEAVQNKTNVTFTFDLVKNMRDYARLHPTAPLACIAAEFDQTCVINVSRALRGVTWKNVNESSPPVKKKLNQHKFADGQDV